MVIPGFIKRLFGSDAATSLVEQQTDDQARVGQIKHEFANHPSKGLTPSRLYQILEGAEHGDLLAQSDLFEDMEEKDPQIGADMLKRRQLAAELEWQIIPPENPSAQEKRAADQANELFSAMEVEDLVLDLGSGLGHGYANLELSWQLDGSMRYIEQPTLRPHRWFRLHPDDQNVLTLRDMSATGAELWPLGWVAHRHRARPGYVARSGLHRMLAWPYLFQNYALGDLAQLLEIYGMPARLGKYPKNATDKEKATLLRAVVSMGKDAAGIIPEGMSIDFLDAAQGRSDVYLAMMNWCERSKSRVILGGTLTSGTGDGTNTNALGNVHERGQSSLIRSDVRQYCSSIRRSILWPLAALNFGIEDANRVPRFRLDMGETEDFQALASSLPTFVDMGARVPVWWLHEKTGIPEASEEDQVLQPRPQQPMTAMLRQQPGQPLAILSQAQRPATPADAIAARMAREGDPQVAAWLEKIEAMLQAAGSLEEFREMLYAAQADLDESQLAALIGTGLSVADLAGRVDLEDASESANG
ncbi:DUF935 domain-containing protein [Pseudomonas extremaustralis]|uniref:DUF935 domain-containing protein n=1 Tax=Pseudomonas extremaustralis TaxID=359110 RepID=UPI002307FC21|nr:DUF935 domain-containing protein [Pseudomonas extremaustralis]MDB1109720.1 DUF935 domain-containing protein [Pseudomonas extremaustralis]